MKQGNHTTMILLLILLFCGVGVYGIFHMSKDEYPEFELTQGLIAAVYPGANALQVEEQLAKPIERALLEFPEVKRQTLNVVSKDGICYIVADTNTPISKKNEVWSKIKLRLNNLKSTLPPGVLAIVVLDDFSAVSASLIAIESSDKSYVELDELYEDLRTRLMRIKNLSAVKIFGDLDEEIAVTLDYERLSSYAINPASLLIDYQSSSLQVPSGSFNGAPIHIHSLVGSEYEIAEKIVYSDPSGAVLRLKDIATIERRYKKPEEYIRYNGHSAIIVSVEMLPNNDIVSFGKELDKVIAEFEQEIPDSVSISRITDQPKLVERSVFNFLRDLLISILVVIAVMMLLFPLKSALIASSCVPVCTLVTIACMYLLGISLNTVTLAVLIFVLGMIVDDSIINIDGYMSNLRKGLTPAESASKATKELLTPMLVATLSISAMFYPMLKTITGYLGVFVTMFPIVVSIALLMSLLYAVLVVPTMEVHLIKTSDPTENLITRVQNRFFDVLQRAYDALQAFCFRIPKTTLLIGLLIVLCGCYIFSKLSIQMLPKSDRDFFAMELSLDANASLEETRVVVDSLQALILPDPRIKSVTAFIGNSAPRFTATYPPPFPGKNFAQLIVNTASESATSALLQEYESKYEYYFPAAQIRMKQIDYQANIPVEIRIFGEDHIAVTAVADSIMTFMHSLDNELKWIHSSTDSNLSSVGITLDSEEATRLGVNKALLSLSLASAFGSEPIATIWEGDKSVPVNVYSQSALNTESYDALGNQIVATSFPGVSVPLRQVAEYAPEFYPSELQRYAGERVATVYADMKFGKSQPVAMAKVQKYIAGLDIPKGLRIEYGGLTEMNAEVVPEILLTFICAMLVMFFALLYHFKKLSLSILTITMSLLCLFGAALGLYIFDLDFTMTAVLGIVGLIGIIVRNGIILYEYAEELRFENGLTVKEAAEEAGKRRMRPIFLTSLTTALGVLPIIISGDQLWMPMGVAICFGTLLTVLFITLIMPVAYYQLYKNQKKGVDGGTK